MPASPPIEPLVALKVPVPRPSRLMPSFALFVELTASNGRVAPLVLTTSTAGPPVALTSATPPDGTLIVPALFRTNAPGAPDDVTRLRSVPEPSPNVVEIGRASCRERE